MLHVFLDVSDNRIKLYTACVEHNYFKYHGSKTIKFRKVITWFI